MLGRDGANGDGPDGRLLAGRELDDRPEALAGDERPRAPGRDDRDGAIELPQRRQIEVVVVEVREQDDVDLGGLPGIERRRPS